MKKAVVLAVASGLAMAAALPQAIPWVSLRELDPAGHLEAVAWLGLVPVLLALDAASTWKGAVGLGLAAGLSFFYGAIWWVNHAMTAFGGVPFPVAFLGLTLLVLYMAAHWAAALLAGWTVRRRLGWPYWVHLPALWAASELSRNYLFTGFPWANLGYLQARHLETAQLASLTGVYGIAALIVFVNCVAYELVVACRARRPLPLRLMGATVGLVVATLVYGRTHLSKVREQAAAAPRLTVGLVQGNVNQAEKNEARLRGATTAQDILERYVSLTQEADRRGVDLVLWPEASYPYLLPPGLQRLAPARTGVPPLRQAHLLMGVATYEERRTEGGARVAEGSNSVLLLRPDLSVIGRYSKHHLVPFGEYVPLEGLLGRFLRSVVPELVPQRPGSALRVLELVRPPPLATLAPPRWPERERPGRPVPGAEPAASTDARASSSDAQGGALHVRLAPMICFDAIFPEVNVAFAAHDPDLLVNPTNDAWYGYSSGPYQFLAMVRMRAIEASRAVVRPAYAGVTAIYEPTGEVRPGALPLGPVDPDLAPDPDEPPRLLVGSVPLLHGRTLYTTVGDLFAYVASAFAMVTLALALRGPRGSSGQEGR